MSYLTKTYYDNELKTFVVEEYTDWGMKKYDGSGNLIAYEKIADDDDFVSDNINDEIDEPDEFFYKLYSWEKRKFEEAEK
ncbi:hypothetical protein [Brachyspira pilosicoli]|uniref:Uncharacterized protein n=1 Tax=Brachyspira pilosicoli TaxID=52584 RepID=A0A5C8F0D7_BRAPL|nr:hypothetical protein [Brachyspira pilosicoli]TXJ43707.1 hypothetical protein EPJ72_03985 [Brachyspira pilosicoli]